MDVINIINFTASVISIIMAVWSYINFRNAKNYSEEASRQIALQRSIYEISKLEEYSKRALEKLKVFGPAANVNTLRGKPTGSASKHVQEYIQAVKKCRHNLQSISDIEQRIDNLTQGLKEFSDALSGKEIKEKGTYLLNTLTDLDSIIFHTHTSLRESINLSHQDVS